jgi:hypothetical protein
LISGRVYATRERFYQLLYVGPKESPVVADLPVFLGSLRLVN